MASATPSDVQETPECLQEAMALKTYCESKFSVGPSTLTWQSVTGEPYTELCVPYPSGLNSAAETRVAAQDHFDRYSANRHGVLYWRISPEIAFSVKRQRYSYYLRLLISDKPRIT
jgi:hypothetical protein